MEGFVRQFLGTDVEDTQAIAAVLVGVWLVIVLTTAVLRGNEVG